MSTAQRKPKRFDRTAYAPLLTGLLDAALDYHRHTAPMAKSGAWKKITDARDKVIAAEDDLKSKANKLEGKLRKYDTVPEEQRPPGYHVGNQNWIALLETYEALWAGRKCIELLMPWNQEPEGDGE